MDSILSASVRYGSMRTRELLFRPVDLAFWIKSALHLSAGDPRQAEIARLKPYYRGTRLLAAAALVLILPALIIPFMELFFGLSGAIIALVVYCILVLLLGFAGLFLEASLDAIFGIAHEAGYGFTRAAREFIGFVRGHPGEAVGYMGGKLLVDMGAMTAVSLFFLPALAAMILVLSSVLHTLEAGMAVTRMTALGGLGLVVLLSVAAVLATMLILVPLSAFYGYYTEEAVRRIRKA
ncbi:MAG TPA: hypothetical protein VMC84_04700 [Methanocella sp.]|uniref:hypothetical protein n=1 Tax=Methanocella sp. TaxID=2052833 RepID=UPI002C63D57E|nr:hypothetical protein [Methanocella sp.]HTY90456.1 hypothetical protein [Methanocella sp.]